MITSEHKSGNVILMVRLMLAEEGTQSLPPGSFAYNRSGAAPPIGSRPLKQALEIQKANTEHVSTYELVETHKLICELDDENRHQVISGRSNHNYA